MKYVTQIDIKEMNKLYAKLKTYAAVARATGFSPATVKKYIIDGYTVTDESNYIRFERPLPEWSVEPFIFGDWGKMCELSDTEFEEIQELWKEVEV